MACYSSRRCEGISVNFASHLTQISSIKWGQWNDGPIGKKKERDKYKRIPRRVITVIFENNSQLFFLKKKIIKFSTFYFIIFVKKNIFFK